MNLATLREELPCDYSVTGSATRLFQKSLISASSHPVLPIPWALKPATLGLSLPVVICLNPFSCLYLLSGTVSFYTLFLFLVLSSSILFNSPSLSMPVWFCLQCFLIFQSPYWVPFSLLQCFFFAIYVNLSFSLSVLPCFSPSSSSSSSSSFSSIYLCYLTSLSIFLPVFLLSLTLSCLCLSLIISLSVCLSLYLPHLCLSLSLEEDCWMDKLTLMHQPTCAPSWRSIEGGGHYTGQS